MHHGKYKEVEAVPQTKYGSTGSAMRVLINKEHGAPVFAMRVIEIEKGGQVGMHEHPYEHEVYILRGKTRVRAGDESVELNQGDFVLVPGGIIHGFENIGDDVLEFICCIPVQD
jgi:quercetin dioxygenase-like cupin family protein